MSGPKALVAWSSGKDSAWAFHVARQENRYEIVGALTTVTGPFTRVSVHGVREELLDAQLASAGLAARKVRIPYPCSNDIYEREMGAAVAQACADGITHIIFGDLFLDDVRAYRERMMAKTGVAPLFPLWGLPTSRLADEMIDFGLRARLICVNREKLPSRFAGRVFNRDLLLELPNGIDPCGENGEFHTFVSAGPMLASPIAVNVGEVVERDGATYVDLLAV